FHLFLSNANPKPEIPNPRLGRLNRIEVDGTSEISNREIREIRQQMPFCRLPFAYFAYFAVNKLEPFCMQFQKNEPKQVTAVLSIGVSPTLKQGKREPAQTWQEYAKGDKSRIP